MPTFAVRMEFLNSDTGAFPVPDFLAKYWCANLQIVTVIGTNGD